MDHIMQTLVNVPYSGKLSREKTFMHFTFVAIRESFHHEIWGHGILWLDKSKQSVKVFLAKVFSLESFPLYSITWSVH